MSLSFDLTDDQQELRERVRAFALERIEPDAAERYRAGEYPVDLLLELGELGVLGLPFPEDVGGQARGLLELGIAIEELGRVDQSVGLTVESAIGLGAIVIDRFGSAEQRERWLPPLIRGERVAGFGLTEPTGGTDTRGLRTRAELDGDAWVVNGQKAWIGNAGSPITSHVTITAKTGQIGDKPEVTALIVPEGTPGFAPGERNQIVGWPTIDNRHLSFTDCRVPVEHQLGERGQGLAAFLSVLDEGRVAIAALAVGLVQGCVDECLRYAQERHAFGRPIGSYQAIAFKVSDLQAAAQLTRYAWYRAAWLRDQGRPFGLEASIAKLTASEAAVTAAREAAQIFGGAGFSTDTRVGRFYRDAKVLEIGEGTSEVQRLLIARALGLATGH